MSKRSANRDQARTKKMRVAAVRVRGREETGTNKGWALHLKGQLLLEDDAGRSRSLCPCGLTTAPAE